MFSLVNNEQRRAYLDGLSLARLRKLALEFDVSGKGSKAQLIERIESASEQYGVDVTDEWHTGVN